MPTKHLIQNLIEGTFATELNIDFDAKSEAYLPAQIKKHQIAMDILEIHLFLNKSNF